MATYAIGDLHGCFSTLMALWESLPFDPAQDRVWLTGDLVNRGPDSLGTLRWARSLGDKATVVLGNHDLHLLCRWRGFRRDRAGDTLLPILDADDGEELLEWLRRRPIFVEGDGWVLVHAGLPPGWSLEEAASRARAIEAVLRGEDFDSFLSAFARAKKGKDDVDSVFRESVDGLVAMTMLRTCHRDGSVCGFTGPPSKAPEGCHPWFELSGKWREGREIVFGHWAALGYYRNREQGVLGLDSGCVWGGGLTAVRLEDGEVFRQPSLEARD